MINCSTTKLVNNFDLVTRQAYTCFKYINYFHALFGDPKPDVGKWEQFVDAVRVNVYHLPDKHGYKEKLVLGVLC